MNNHTHHSITKSTHGKFFKSLVPWRNKEAFDNKFYYDKRTQAPPKSMLQNNLMNSISKDQEKIKENDAIYNEIFRLKDNSFLRDDKLQFKKSPGADKVTYIYNDYYQKRAKDGFSRNPSGGNGWFH